MQRDITFETLFVLVLAKSIGSMLLPLFRSGPHIDTLAAMTKESSSLLAGFQSHGCFSIGYSPYSYPYGSVTFTNVHRYPATETVEVGVACLSMSWYKHIQGSNAEFDQFSDPSSYTPDLRIPHIHGAYGFMVHIMKCAIDSKHALQMSTDTSSLIHMVETSSSVVIHATSQFKGDRTSTATPTSRAELICIFPDSLPWLRTAKFGEPLNDD